MTLKPITLGALLATTALICPIAVSAQPAPEIDLQLLGTYQQPDPAAAFDESAAEIVAHIHQLQQLVVVNGFNKTLDIISIRNPVNPILVDRINVADNPDFLAFGGFVGGGANSVAVRGRVIAAAIEAETVTDPGAVAFFNANNGRLIHLVRVGALPDMLTFTPDHKRLLVANEGEPDNGIDPEGSVSIIDLSKSSMRRAVVTTADFNAFDSQVEALKAAGVRLFPDVLDGTIRLSQDLEPEYIAVDPAGETAWITLQEANSIAVLDLASARITEILPLGSKDHHLSGYGLDPSDRDGGININPWPVRGMFLPDAITSYTGHDGQTYYITANEGDDRGDADEDPRGDVIRFKDIADVTSFGRDGLEPSDALQAAIDVGLQDDNQLGRLNISSIDGIDADGKLDQLYSYGARSFTIWNQRGRPVWDSGDSLEQVTAAAFPEFFNASNDANFGDDGLPALDDRSDNKGPEPEAIVVEKLFGRLYAFVGLERIGGVAIYTISESPAPRFINYINNRNFEVSNEDLEAGLAGDLGPEGLLIIPRRNSPIRAPLLVVANEVSGTTSIFRIQRNRL